MLRGLGCVAPVLSRSRSRASCGYDSLFCLSPNYSSTDLGVQLMPFKGVDFYRIDDLLSDEERMVRDTVRRFVDERVVPIIDKHFEEATFPSELIPEMAEMGLFGGTLPEEYGCANMNNVAYGLVMQELERGSSGLRSFVSVQGALVMYPIFSFGTEEQKQKWLPLLARGQK